MNEGEIKKKKEKKDRHDLRPAASVIILAYQKSSTICDALDSVLSQDFTEPYEIIVIWSGDKDLPVIINKKYPEVKIFGHEERLFTGESRNLGVEHSTGEIIVFLAGDCRVKADWLGNRVSAHRNGFNCVGGAILCSEPSGKIAEANHLLEYSEHLTGRPRELVKDRLVFNLSFKRNIFDKYGIYEPGLACGEDSIFNWRLLKEGEQFLFDPSIITYHTGPAGIKDFIGHQFWHGKYYSKLLSDFSYTGSTKGRIIPFWIFLFIYPWIRILRLSKRIFKWRRDLTGRLIILFPIIFLGVVACTSGMLYGRLKK